ncbi:hypothetical protein MVES1_000043 [Malassezia vespertilionis]|uniref:uncharacterized protein n=1 Tax=Malassezia vespertilionis TaxID=2020962 RepID=UPI0024B1D19E|nr:uncharacterized protein MVES1_000043 [Malassezia vespertilionis]WFD04719.1 hypothetical protein MVES1_000043 [Malassezia vespertilionis]
MAADRRGTAVYSIDPLLDALPSVQGAAPGSPADLRRAVRYVSAYERHVYVATNDGYVHHFVNASAHPPQPASREADWVLEQSLQVSSLGRPVEKVLVLHAVALVAILCENTLRFYAYPSLAPGTWLPVIRGVTQAVMDDAEKHSAGFVSICLLKRQRLQLIVLEHAGWATVKEMAIARDAVIARRCNEILCVATPTEYCLINLETGEQTPLMLPISQSTTVSSALVRPCVVSVSFPSVEGALQTFLITSHSDTGTLGAFIRPDGEPSDRLVEWPSHPRSVVYSAPYLCALLRNDTIHVHDMRTMHRTQVVAIEQEDARLLLDIAPNTQVHPGRALFSTSTVDVPLHGTTLTAPTPFPTGASLPIDALLVLKRSVSCFVCAAPTDRALRAIQENDWKTAQTILALNTEEDMHFSVIALLVGLHHVLHTRFLQAVPYLVRGRLDIRLLLAKFPQFDVLLAGRQEAPMASAALALWTELPASISELITLNLALNYAPHIQENVYAPLHAALLARADTMLEQVLAASKCDTFALAQAALVSLYLSRDPRTPMDRLLPHLMHCTADVGSVLEMHHRYLAYAQLLLAHNRRTEALRIWVRVLDGDLRDAYDTITTGDVATEAARLASRDDIAEFGLWLARHNTQLGLDVLLHMDFTDEAQARKTWAALCALDSSAAARLLEHVVFTELHQAAGLHAELCMALADTVTKALVNHTYPKEATVHAYTLHPTECFAMHIARLAARLDSAVLYARVKLMLLLAYSNVLDNEQIYDQLAVHQEFVFEKAILLVKMQRNDEALLHVAIHLRDARSAQAFCLQPSYMIVPAVAQEMVLVIGIPEYASVIPTAAVPSNRTKTRVLLQTLLHIYTQQTLLDTFEPAIVRLVCTAPCYFDITLVLALVPAHWRVAQFAPYLVSALRTGQHKKRMADMVKAMSYTRTKYITAQHWGAVRAAGGVFQDEAP